MRCGLLFAIVLLSTLASADEQDLLKQGVELRRQGRDAEALVLFRSAYQVRPTARAKAQVALAEQALGRWLLAEADLTEALASTDDPWVAEHRDDLANALLTIQRHLGWLRINVNLDDLEIWIDGENRGRIASSAIRVASGKAAVELKSGSITKVGMIVDVRGGATATQNLVLPVANNRAATSPPSMPLVAAHSPIASDDSRPKVWKSTAWATAGTAGALLAVSLGAQWVRWQKAQSYNDDQKCLVGTMSREERCGEYRREGESAQRIATVGYVAAGALGVASGLLFLTVPRPRSGPAISISVNSLPGGLWAGCGGDL